MSDVRDEKIREIIHHQASAFLNLESNKTALMTVTGVRIYDNGSKATVFFTVFPEDKQAGALDFAKRKRSEFKKFLREETRLTHLPFVDFDIDLGEKNRQKIDQLSQM